MKKISKIASIVFEVGKIIIPFIMKIYNEGDEKLDEVKNIIKKK